MGIDPRILLQMVAQEGGPPAFRPDAMAPTPMPLSPTPMAPERPAIMPSPGGPFGVPGEALDDFARQVLQSTQGFRPRSDFEGFLSGLAGGLANTRLRSAARRDEFNEGERALALERAKGDVEAEKERRRILTERASGLARHRWDMARDRARAEADALEKGRERDWQSGEKEKDRRAYGYGARSGGGGGGGGAPSPGDEDLVTAWTRLVKSGQASLTSVPRDRGVRDAVVLGLLREDSPIIPGKVRETIANIGSARGIVDELKAISDNVNTASGPGRFAAGASSLMKSTTQSSVDDAVYSNVRDGFLATISRATGERGVLTDRDVFRARQLLPARFDSKAVANAKIRGLRSFLDNLEQRTIRAYMSESPGETPINPDTAAPSPPDDSDMDGDSRYLRGR